QREHGEFFSKRNFCRNSSLYFLCVLCGLRSDYLRAAAVSVSQRAFPRTHASSLAALKEERRAPLPAAALPMRQLLQARAERTARHRRSPVRGHPHWRPHAALQAAPAAVARTFWSARFHERSTR